MLEIFFPVRMFVYGFFLWLIPFISAIPLFQLLGSNRIFFKTIMGIILSFSASVIWNLHLKRINSMYLKHAYVTSLIWILLSVIPDLIAFIIGFKMELHVYLSEIALSYLVISVILINSAYLLEIKLK